VDRQNFVRQDRRLDGKPFRLQDGRSAKSRTIGSPSYPVGLPADKPVVMLVEGSSDLLAAYALIHAEHMENEVAPVAILGASNIIHDNALPYFNGKYVLGFPDYDKAGIAGMTRWQRQLKNIAAEFRVFDYHGLKRDDGEKIKDVRDFLRIDVDQWENDGEVRSPLGNFMVELFREDAIHATD
jgi:hypothetical protein